MIKYFAKGAQTLINLTAPLWRQHGSVAVPVALALGVFATPLALTALALWVTTWVVSRMR